VQKRWAGIALLLVVLAAQEIAFRFLFPLPELAGFNRIHYMPVGPAGKKVVAVRSLGMIVESSPDHRRVVETLNEYGFRDGRWRTRKAADERRAIFIGDSYVEGILASNGNTIPEVFRAEAAGRGLRVETMNMGVAASGLSSYAELLVDTVPAFHPDMVFVVVYANDLPDKLVVPQPRVFERHVSFTPRLVELFLMASRQEMLPYRWQWREERQSQPVPSPNNPWSDASFAEEYEKNVAPWILSAMKAGEFNPVRMGGSLYMERDLRTRFDIRPGLAALRDYSERYGSRLSVVYVPERGTVTNHYKQFEKEFSRLMPVDTDMTGPEYQMHRYLLRAQCAEVGVAFFDATDTIMREEMAGRHLYWDYDDHMRDDGYREVGKAIFDWWSQDVAP
jgi:hypothetical protein